MYILPTLCYLTYGVQEIVWKKGRWWGDVTEATYVRGQSSHHWRGKSGLRVGDVSGREGVVVCRCNSEGKYYLVLPVLGPASRKSLADTLIAGLRAEELRFFRGNSTLTTVGAGAGGTTSL